jgi:alpha-beta hydrolase superfamily lysophospholipase
MARVPLLIYCGSDDSLGGEKSVLKLGEAYINAGQDDVTVTVYPGGRHEMFNETNKEEVFDDVISWISERTSS